MDLKRLYARHQISLIHALNAPDADTRAFHRFLSEGFGRRIEAFRTDLAARAAVRSCRSALA